MTLCGIISIIWNGVLIMYLKKTPNSQIVTKLLDSNIIKQRKKAVSSIASLSPIAVPARLGTAESVSSDWIAFASGSHDSISVIVINVDQ